MWHRQPKLITSLIVLILLVSQSAQAQDEPSPYDIALQRIEEARTQDSYRLNLYDLQLREVPTEIGQLNKLGELRLDRNQLAALPSEIWQLTSLESLYNQLSELSSEVGQLT